MGVKITSLKVAHRAGVSRAAASRVFTPGASVSARSRKKVRKAAREMRYGPNVLARLLIQPGQPCGPEPSMTGESSLCRFTVTDNPVGLTWLG